MEQEPRDGDCGQAAEPLLALTAAAVEMMKQTLAQAGMTEGGIRMTVAGGGCEGFQYRLQLAASARPDDTEVVQDGVRAFLDPVSARHLRGTLLDYVSNRHGVGFHFFGLDAAYTIGCGSPLLLRRCIAGNNRTMGCTNSARRPLLEVSHAVAPSEMGSRTSIAHPNLRLLSICQQCRYVICRCAENG
jgi:iron-sulfur cluster assembly protein